MAFSFEGLETFKTNDPRSMAVLRSEFSACSNPRKNSIGSVSDMFTLTPPPEATGFSSGRVFTLLIMLFAEFRPDDHVESEMDGLLPLKVLVMALTAPAGFLGVDLISVVARSGKDVTELRVLLALLLVDDLGRTISVGSGLEAKWLSINDRKKRFAPSRGPASFSVKYDLLVVCFWRLRSRGSGAVRAM